MSFPCTSTHPRVVLQSLAATSSSLVDVDLLTRVRVQIKVRLFSKKYCSPCVSTQLHLNIWLDSPRSEKKSVLFRIEKINFLRKLWSLLFLAKKLTLISFILSNKNTNFNNEKTSKNLKKNMVKKCLKNFFFLDLTHSSIYLDYYKFI